MWLLNAVFAGMAVVLMALERRSIKEAFPYLACLALLLVSAGLVLLKPLFAGLNVTLTLVCCVVYALLVIASAVVVSPVLRGLLQEKFNQKSAVIQP